MVISDKKLSDAEQDKVRKQCDPKSISFAATTYTDLIATLETVCENHSDLVEILEDFKSFIGQQGLLPEQHRWLVAMLCGTSWRENIKFKTYFAPAHRNAKWINAKFLGIYRSKQISHIGRIEASAICRVVEGELKVDELEFNDCQSGNLTGDQKDRIIKIVEASEKHFGKFAEEPHRFYLVDDFTETKVTKEWSGGMMGHRYFDLYEWDKTKAISPNTTGPKVSEIVRGKDFT